MDIEYEKTYHSIEKTNWWFKSRRHLILHYMKEFRPSNILDVGCSSGTLMKSLKSNGFSGVYGVDISKSAVDKCRKQKLQAFLADAKKTDFKNYFFDAIIAADVLEHTSSDTKTLREWNRILKPGGKIVLFVPAFMHLWSSHDKVNHHRKRYRLPELFGLAKKHGFIVKKATYWNFALYFPRVPITLLNRVIGTSAKFDRAHPVVNTLLYWWLLFENALIKMGVRFPFGISCFMILEKK